MSPWWKRMLVRRGARPTDRPSFFEIACACGQVHRGMREAERQILSCEKCGERVFALPRSEWPAVEAHAENGPQAPERKPSSGRDDEIQIKWMPLLAAATLLGVCVAIPLLYLHRPRSPVPEVEEHLNHCQEALARGDFAGARQLLRRYEEQSARRSSPLTPDYWRLQRQMDLLQRLPKQTLAELVMQVQVAVGAAQPGRGAAEAESGRYFSRFQDDLRTMAVILDAPVRRDESGETPAVRIDYEGRAAKDVVRVELGEVAEELAARLPKVGSERLVFGARLGSLRLEDRGVWVARFQPGTVVFFDEPEFRTLLELPADGVSSPLSEPVSTFLKRRGAPDFVVREIVGDRYLEQWTYRANEGLRVLMEKRRGQPLRPAGGVSVQILPEDPQ
jgi:hypothetical protein